MRSFDHDEWGEEYATEAQSRRGKIIRKRGESGIKGFRDLGMGIKARTLMIQAFFSAADSSASPGVKAHMHGDSMAYANP